LPVLILLIAPLDLFACLPQAGDLVNCDLMLCVSSCRETRNSLLVIVIVLPSIVLLLESRVVLCVPYDEIAFSFGPIRARHIERQEVM